METKAEALMKFLSQVANRLGVGKNVYVVGGAVRNWIMGIPPKDIDIVIDSVTIGKDSEWFANELADIIPARTNVTTNNYGVAILSISEPWDLEGHDMKGETIEIANARTESYGGAEGKGYKPDMVKPATIKEDLFRREFTFNTLLWRLSDLAEGPDKAEVLDLLGRGRSDLEDRTLQTPVDPNKTFSDDPTRMLRAIKFVAKYGFKVPPDMVTSIKNNAHKLKNMPWDAVRKILTDDILDAPNPRNSIILLKNFGIAEVIREIIQEEPGFATALGRSLSDKESLVLLDLLDLEWAIRTPLSFLNQAGQVRLRTILLSLSEEEGHAFVENLKKPQIDQPLLFNNFNVPPKERGKVIEIARQSLLVDPTLVHRPKELEANVKQVLEQRYSS